MSRHVPVYEMRGGSGLANWLEFVSLSHPTALLTVGTRAYEVRRVVPHLTRGSIPRMKKPSTQILTIVKSRLNIDGGSDLTADDVAVIEGLTKVINKQDQEYRKNMKPKKPAHTPAATKAAKKRKVGR